VLWFTDAVVMSDCKSMFGVVAKLCQHALDKPLWSRKAYLAEAGTGVLITVFHIHVFNIYTFNFFAL